MVDSAAKKRGLALFTATYRASGPDVFDLRLNSHSRLNLIQALLQALEAGADEALMLDPHGFVASCNSTNFLSYAGANLTSSGLYCFNGITRRTILNLARRHGLPVREKTLRWRRRSPPMKPSSPVRWPGSPRSESWMDGSSMPPRVR